ncbi:hypothetical protein INT80_14495 [Gallibacterium anatis]|uniref:Uncharacterized protein n=1 Tax=Gallibacterium anatis TaxID=750 RepID=A0A930YAY6_9PAST|nr:hypothetical protein [Gallibacterium anatis]
MLLVTKALQVLKTFTVLDTVVPGDTNSDGVADSEDDNGGKPNVLVVDAHTSDNHDKPVGSDDLKRRCVQV